MNHKCKTTRIGARINANPYLLMILLYYVIILIYGRSNNIISAVSWGLIAIWYLGAYGKIKSNYTCSVNMGITTITMFMVIAYMSIWDLEKYGIISFVSSFFRYFMMFIPFYMFLFVMKKGYYVIKGHIRLLLFLYVALAFAQCILYIMAEDPEYARNIIGTDRGYFAFIADAYGLCQTAGFLAIGGFAYMFKKKKKWSVILLFFLNNAVIFLTKSTLLILCYCVTLLYVILSYLFDMSLGHYIKGKYAKTVIKFLMFAIIFLMFLFSLNNLGNSFLNISDNVTGIVGRRLNELGTFLTTKNRSSDITSRFNLYTISIKTALKNPIFGNYSSYMIGKINVIGNHSELLDMPARFGFPVTIIFFSLIFNFMSVEEKMIGFKIPGLRLIYFTFILVNPFNYSIAYFTLFYMVPLLVYVLENKEAEYGKI